MMKRSFFTLLVLLTALIMHCTNPFTTRTPEAPEGDNTLSRNLQTDPNTILTKIQQSFQQRDTQNYFDCLADTVQFRNGFNFVPEQAEADRLNNWQREEERTYFFNLINADELDRLQVDILEQTFPAPVTTSPDTLEMDFAYLITVKFRTKTERYQGRSILKILKSTGELWFVYEWLDLQDTDGDVSDSTWSTLKANYRISG